MRISDHRINIKTLTFADLGWSSSSHQTHIGLSKNFMDGWDNHLGLEGYLAIKDFGYEPVSIYTGPIVRKNGRIDAPNIKTTANNKKLERKNPSIIKRIKDAGKLISDKFKTDKILFIFCFNEKNQPIVILSELEDSVLIHIKNNTNLVGADKKINLKLVNKNDRSFKYIKNLAQFYSEIIEAGLSFEENIELIKEGVFEFENIEDARKKINRSIVLRQGQAKFRNNLLENYEYKCAITGCDVIPTLEACHIFPYMGSKTNSSSNGILLRSDLHTLYDRSKICIDQNYKILMKDDLYVSDFYKHYKGKKITLPKNKILWPNKLSLNYNLQNFKKN